MMLLTLAVLLAALALCLAAPRLAKAGRYRHLPGPWGWPLLGSLPALTRRPLHARILGYKQRYGPTFKVWVGSVPQVIIAEPKLARAVNAKLAARPPGASMAGLVRRQVTAPVDAGLLFANGPLWRTLRAAWMPAFKSGAVRSYCAALAQGGMQGRLVAAVGAAASSPESAAAGIDLHPLLGLHSVHVKGHAFFGLDFDELRPAVQGSCCANEGGLAQQLFSATRAITTFPDHTRRPRCWWWLLSLVLPGNRAVKALAQRFPDAALRGAIDCFATLTATSRAIYARAVTAQPDHSAQPEDGADNLTADADGRQAPGVGSFVQLMLAAQHKGPDGGAPLDASLVQSQIMQVLLAGSDSVAVGILFLLFSLARHPAIAAVVAEEVDTWRARASPEAASDAGAPASLRLDSKADPAPAPAPPSAEDLPLLDACIKETLRLYPPQPWSVRFAPEGLQMEGHSLPPRALVRTAIYCLHRDPEYWPRADEFLPARWLPAGVGAPSADVEPAPALTPQSRAAYMPFGCGTRLCMGERFAVAEMRAAAAALLAHYSFVLPPGVSANWEPPLVSGVTLWPAQPLHLLATPR